MVATLAWTAPAAARTFRLQQVPHGSDFGCGLCHVNPTTPGARSIFGLQVEATLVPPLAGANVVWSALYHLDADSDDVTNGMELGDPSGTWVLGTPYPTAPTSDPNDPQDVPCGNGVREGGDLCDGPELAGLDCASEGFEGGSLACGEDCASLDYRACLLGCGNDHAEAGELCDGTDVGDRTCQDEGFASGTLTCAANCQAYDDVGCFGSLCGNGVIDAGERCDGNAVGDWDCASEGYIGGTLRCAGDCWHWNTTGCYDATCGNGLIETGELCDGSAVSGRTCADEGFSGGTLTCAGDCWTYDTTACTPQGPACNNGTREVGELCDGPDLGGATCASVLPGTSGTLTCSATCAFNTSRCQALVPADTGCACNAGASNALGACLLFACCALAVRRPL